ncbi:MAG: amidohydrolase family protein, partial [Gemmatimonadota bacterium]
HVHVSDVDDDGAGRGDILGPLLDVLDQSGADLRPVLSVDLPWVRRMAERAEEVIAGNRFVRELVRRAPGRLAGSCTVNPQFLDASREAMRLCFEAWGFRQLGEMLPYLMDYRMDTPPMRELVRAAADYGVPVQVHISTSNRGPQGPFPGGGTEQLEDLMDLVERVPEGRWILAHLVGTERADPPVVAGYLDQIEARFGRWPDPFWAEIRDFNSPGVAVALERIPRDRIIAGTDWVSRGGPPFLPYGVIYGVADPAANPYPPGVESMVGFLREAGATEAEIDRIGYRNAAELLGIV